MMPHDELARDLAGHLRGDRRMTWEDVQLGPSGSVRPDVYAVYKSYVNPCPVAYECKVSTADFRSDVTSGKWQSYLKYAAGVYFACETGLIAKKDVPAHCGLMVRGEGGWRAAKKATLSPVVIPQEALLKLLIDGVQREGPRYRGRAFIDSQIMHNFGVKFGAIAARVVRDRLSVEAEIHYAEQTAKRIVEVATERGSFIRKESALEIEPLRKDICDILQMPHDTDKWRLVSEVKRMRKERDEHPAHANLRVLTDILTRALHNHGYREPAVAEQEV